MNPPVENKPWKSTRFRYAVIASAFLALCLAFGAFAMPLLGYEPISDTIAVALIIGITGNGGVYTWFKTREHQTLIETNGNGDRDYPECR